MRPALIGLGGNIGNPREAMATALRGFDGQAGTGVLAVSRLYRTPPWGRTDQPPFLNAVARIETDLDPGGLLARCLDAERELKRERLERWGPRTIDLDILDMDGVVCRDDRLTLPHPRITERAFVLVPLSDLAPDHRIHGRRPAEWLEALDRAGIEPVTPDGDWWR